MAGCSLLLWSIGPAVAAPPTTVPADQVTGTSPWAGDPGGLTPNGGTVFFDSEVEPWVDVSPADSAIVAGIWLQVRWSNGGARGNAAAISFDGGTTWQDPLLTFPGVTDCTGGDFDRASDPWRASRRTVTCT